jgi:hypothetical protein
LKAGPSFFSIRFTSDPAYRTLTGPDPWGTDRVLDAGAVAPDGRVVGAVVLDELAHPAARAAIPTPAANQERDLVMGGELISVVTP